MLFLKKNNYVLFNLIFFVILMLFLQVPQSAYANLYNFSNVAADTLPVELLPIEGQWRDHILKYSIVLNLQKYWDFNYYYPSDTMCVDNDVHHLNWKILFKDSTTNQFVEPAQIFVYAGFNDPLSHNVTLINSFPCYNHPPSTSTIDIYEWADVTYENQRFHCIFPPGTYYCKVPYAVLPLSDEHNYSDQEIWDIWDSSNSSFTFRITHQFPRDIYTPTVELINYDDWEEWLPIAPGFGQSSSNNITLRFKLNMSGSEANTLDYKVRFRVYDITWYPGTRTNSVDLYGLGRQNIHDNYNKYHQQVSPTDTTKLLNQEWLERYTWRGSTDSTLNDFIIKDSLNPDYTVTWNQGIADFTDSSLVQGYYELEHNSELVNGSTLEITYSSRDFAARCWTMPYISFKDSSGTYTGWYPTIIYKRQFDHMEDFILPLPRDEEPLRYVMNIKGVDSTYIGRGDRMADAWEEFYSFDKDSSKIKDKSLIDRIRDNLIFSDIIDSKPYFDNSNFDTTYYPESYITPIGVDYTVKDAGDGILNFEKYRGFYGVLDENLDKQFVRLNPSRRNIFITPIDEITNPNFSDSLYRGENIEYFTSISNNVKFHLNSGTTSIKLHVFKFQENDSNIDDAFQYYLIKEPPLFYSKDANTFNYDYVSSLLLNRYVKNIPGIQPIVSVFNVQILPAPSNFHNYLLNKYPDYLNPQTAFMGVASGSKIQNSDYPNLILPNRMYTSIVNINTIINKRYAIEIDSTQDTLYNYDWIRKQISKTFAHELGHLVFMQHPIGFNSIMTQGSHKEPYNNFHYGDFRSFLLSEIIEYSNINGEPVER